MHTITGRDKLHVELEHGDLLGAPPASSPDGELTPIDHFLREQQTMTAVERFSRHHDQLVEGVVAEPAQAKHYRNLIPLTTPRPGEQYAFTVDLDSCSGCKACVTACHSLNGLAEDESFRSVGALHTTRPGAAPWQQTVTTACHHCLDPGCLNGCPVDAYEKDPVTGVVAHLDDQCIGCRYCTLMCPYEVPAYNEDLGIVRKCDLCQDRLAEGEAPACVQACPTSAISVSIIEVEPLRAALARSDAALVPTAPASRITMPTTTYRRSEPIPEGALPDDHYSLHRSHAHVPLTVMLVLTQFAVGTFVLALLTEGWIPESIRSSVRPYEAGLALAVALVALAASVLHLGRPQYAWRAVIGLRHSWLSREIVAFGAFAGLAALYAGSLLVDAAPTMVAAAGWSAAVAGVAGVAFSSLIYAATRRTWWRLQRIGPKFLATTIVTGSLAVVFVATLAAGIIGDGAATTGVLRGLVAPLAAAAAAVSTGKLLAELTIFRHGRALRLGPSAAATDLGRTALLLADDLRQVTVWRLIAGVVGGVLLPLVLIALALSTAPIIGWVVVLAFVSLGVTTVGELCERYSFFAAVTAPRMPGINS